MGQLSGGGVTHGAFAAAAAAPLVGFENPTREDRTVGFKALADRAINVQAISTSEIKISVLIDADETELAVRVLHTAYGLDAEDPAE